MMQCVREESKLRLLSCCQSSDAWNYRKSDFKRAIFDKVALKTFQEKLFKCRRSRKTVYDSKPVAVKRILEGWQCFC